MLCVIGRVYADDQDWTEEITPDMVVLVWSQTTTGRALRRLIVDLYAEDVTAEYLERVRDDLHPEFIKDLMMKAMQIKDGDDHALCVTRRGCHYHEHDDDDEASRCCKGRALRLE